MMPGSTVTRVTLRPATIGAGASAPPRASGRTGVGLLGASNDRELPRDLLDS